tara:strand:- start:570 stop:1202 length:633 start_codon:yes stop_codon:yes gene_type:complete
MRRLFYTLSIFSFFFVLGCQQEGSFHEVRGDVFFVDKKGNVFVLDERESSIKKIKVETFNDPLPTLLINDKITKTKIVNWDRLNFQIDVLLKYVGGTCHYRVTIKQRDKVINLQEVLPGSDEPNDIKWSDTDSYKRIINNEGSLLTVKLVEEDNFTLKEIRLVYNEGNMITKVNSGGDYIGFEFEGSMNLSKDLFSKITDIRITTNIDPL